MVDEAVKARFVDVLDEADGNMPSSVIKRKEDEEKKVQESLEIARKALSQLGDYVDTLKYSPYVGMEYVLDPVTGQLVMKTKELLPVTTITFSIVPAPDPNVNPLVSGIIFNGVQVPVVFSGYNSGHVYESK